MLERLSSNCHWLPWRRAWKGCITRHQKIIPNVNKLTDGTSSFCGSAPFLICPALLGWTEDPQPMVLQATRILKNQNFNEVLSIEKSGFRFLNTDFGFPIKRGIQKQFLTPRNLSLDFPTVRFCGKSEKRFAKLSSRTTVSHAHSFLPEKRPLFTSTVLQIFFRISPLPHPPPPPKKSGNEGNPWNPDLDLFIEIHLDHGFLSVFGCNVLLYKKFKSGFQNLSPDFQSNASAFIL